MTPEMIEKSRENAKRKNSKNVQFRLGELEYLPVADSSVDVVISNCVINLVSNKFQVFKEVFRVLKSGGRLCISDTVTSIPLPESVRSDLRLFAGCIAGATLISDMETMLRENGFCDIKITPKDESKEFIKEWAPSTKIDDFVKSAIIEAKKP
jgi:ubiquinone/menaquinone biosynthesis C-methylase UbiE